MANRKGLPQYECEERLTRLSTTEEFTERQLLCLGLQQLHGLEIAHQDLKPSNVLTFPEGLAKIADLGHAATRTVPSPQEGEGIAADPAYAPVEQWYSYRQLDAYRNRLASDMYLFGSLISFMFSRFGMTALIAGKLNRAFHPNNWAGTYGDVLPYLQAAFGEALEMLRDCLPPEVSADTLESLRYLCEPDPLKRGHPRDRVGHHNQYSLERFVSRFNLLAKKAEHGLLG